MARIARLVAPGIPHHVTQRGNRRQPTFFCDQDCLLYREPMAHCCAECGVEVWAYCLVPNHVHLICVPSTKDSLAEAIGEAHRRHSRRIGPREGWSGHPWQACFASFPMDDGHLYAAVQYAELNPVRAGLVSDPTAYRWSIAWAHVAGRDDALVKVPLLGHCAVGGSRDWREILDEALAREAADAFHLRERTGRPLGRPKYGDTITHFPSTLGARRCDSGRCEAAALACRSAKPK